MKTRHILLLSIACHTVLAATIWLRSGSRISPGNDRSLDLAAPAATGDGASQKAGLAGRDSFPQSSEFHWAQLESADYHDYIANLRRIRCPEETIRDLVLADVRKLFGGKRRELLQSTSRAGHAIEAQLAQLRLQEGQTLDALLGADWRETAACWEDDPATGIRLAFLKPAVASRVRQVEDRYDALLQARLAQAAGFVAADDHQAIRSLEKERYRELAGFLEPADYVQYFRGHHSLGVQMDAEGFAYRDPQEFLAVMAAREKVGEVADPAQQEAAEAESQSRIREVLGDARYTTYRRALSSEYRVLCQLTGRFGLDDTFPARVQDLQDHLQEQLRQLETQGLSEITVEAARKALARQTADQVRELLGPTVYQAWQGAGLAFLAVE